MGANSNISPERGTIPSPLTARPPAIEPDTLRLLYTNSIIGLAASLILATVVAITHWSVISHVVLLAWWSGMALLTAARTISIVRFRKFPGEPRSTSPWFAWHFAGTALSGVAWSTAGIFLFAPDSSEHQVFLIGDRLHVTIGTVGLLFLGIMTWLAWSLNRGFMKIFELNAERQQARNKFARSTRISNALSSSVRASCA